MRAIDWKDPGRWENKNSNSSLPGDALGIQRTDLRAGGVLWPWTNRSCRERNLSLDDFGVG